MTRGSELLDNGQFTCNFNGCTKKFKGYGGLDQHIKKEHLMEFPFKCNKCDKSYIYNCYLEKHLTEKHTSSDKPFKCTFSKRCMKKNVGFKTKGELKMHRIRHNGEKRFLCGICKKAFITKHELNVHLNYHSGARPYPCRIKGCTRKFQDPSNRSSHEKKFDHSRMMDNNNDQEHYLIANGGEEMLYK